MADILLYGLPYGQSVNKV